MIGPRFAFARFAFARFAFAGLATALAFGGMARAQDDTLARPALSAPVMTTSMTASSAFMAPESAIPYGAPTSVDLADRGHAPRMISIPAGGSAMIDLPVEARDVTVANPKVADAVLLTSRKISILGVAPGQTDAAFFDAAGRRILGLNIRVDQNVSAVADTIARILPGSDVHVEGLNASLVLTGQVSSREDADKAAQIAQQFTAKPEQVLNMLAVAEPEQVMLRVRIVEVDRSLIKQLGVNLSATLGQAGSPQFIASMAAGFGVNGALLGGLTSGFAQDTTQQPETMEYDPNTKAFDIPIVCRSSCTNGGQGVISTTQTTSGSTGLNKAGGSLQAYEQAGIVRTLAEPNLTTVSGEAAKFLAGGEFPVPTSQSVTGQVSVEFKPFGIGLGFTPVVLSGGRISLKISTEVSELSSQGGFNLSTGTSATTGSTTAAQVLSIPALTVRRASTVVELPSGGAMMIAGLLKEETKQDIDSLPGLMNLPVLGALFRSRDYQEGETELVVIVTPYLVKPTSPDKLQTPADGLQMANDAQTILLGQLNKVYHAPAQAAATAEQHGYQGPVGYVIE